jgi:4-amino-4-deoxy-L-arabinose transferase-like glycosyltransferase
MSSVTTPSRFVFPFAGLASKISLLLHPERSSLLCIVLLLSFCGILFFYGLNVGELWRTEGLRAIIAAEFLRTGNWVVPVLYGEPLFTKPPGMYAAIALCSWPVGGVTLWTARLPSALAATATVFLIYWYVGRQLGRRGGLVAALVLPLSPMWLEKATAAEIDMLHLMWTTAAIVFFLRALEDEEAGSLNAECRMPNAERMPNAKCRMPKSVLEPFALRPSSCFRHSTFDIRHSGFPLWWFAAFLCVAAGVMTKWTTPVFFYGMALPLLWWRGQLRLLWGRQHLMGLALAVGVCLAWAATAVWLTGWDVFASTIEREAMQRLSPRYSPRPYPWLESLGHPLKLLLINLPFSAVALLALRPGFSRLWDEKGRRLLQALHCWTWPNMLFWSLPTEHTPRHSFPLFPGLAGLAAMVILAWMNGKLAWRVPRIRPGQVLAVLVAAWLLLKIMYVQVAPPHHAGARQPRDKGELLAGLIPLGQVLYVFNFKDEGIMFYYGRPVLRLQSPQELPRSTRPVYCVLLLRELEAWRDSGRMEVVRRLADQQGDPMVLVRVSRS